MTNSSDRPNSDTMPKAENPFPQPSVQTSLPLTTASLNKRVAGGQSAKQKERRAVAHSEIFDEQGGHVKPLGESEGMNNGFVPHPDTDKIEEMRKRSEEARLKSAAAESGQNAVKKADKITTNAMDTKADKPAQADDKVPDKTLDTLDAVFGKKPQRRDLVNPGNWTHDIPKFNHFTESIRQKGFLKHHITPTERPRLIRAALGYERSLHEISLAPLQAEVKVLAHIEKWVKTEKKKVFEAFQRELGKLKTIIYIDEDVLKALGGQSMDAHVAEHGIEETHHQFDLYLGMVRDVKELRVAQPKEKTPDTAAEETSPALSYRQTTKTSTGIALADIVTELNKPYPNEALFNVPKNKRAPKDARGVYPRFVHARVEQVFGAENIDWRFATHPNSAVHYGEETEQKKDEQTGEIKETVWYVVRVEMFIFQYAVFTADGSMDWIAGSPLSDTHKNMDRQSAYRGAMSSLLKQVVGRMGGFKAIRGQMATQPANPQEQSQAQQPSTANARGVDTSQQVGLTPEEMRQFFQWVDGLKIARSDVIGMLGITDWKQWKGGLAAAKAKIEEVRRVTA